MPRSYAPQFRAMVVEQVRSGRSVAEVAADLELSESTVFRWVRQDRIDRGELEGTSTVESADLRAAKRRIAELEAKLATVKRASELFDEGRVVRPKDPFAIVESLASVHRPWDQAGVSAPSGSALGLFPMAFDATEQPGHPTGVAQRRHRRDPRAVPADVRVASRPRGT
jgi:transposase